ncbi:MAG: lipopolysaccharide biosynthesis protein [Bacteroidota bacterium]
MGNIAKQSYKGTIYTYLGIILGFITTGLLFPSILTPEQIGLISIILAYATIFGQAANMGFQVVLTRFFPYFKDEKKGHNGLFFVALLITSVGLIIACLILFFLKDTLVKDNALLSQFYIFLYGFAISFGLFILFDQYCKVLFNATLGIMLKEVVQRILILLSLLFLYFQWISFDAFVSLYAAIYFLLPFILLLFLLKEKQFFITPDFSKFTPDFVREIIPISLFGILTSFAGMITINIDKIMIERYTGLEMTGIYTIAFFFGGLIRVPSRPILKISSIHIAECWKKNNRKEITAIYNKSSMIQFVIGMLTLIGLWANIDNIFRILPDTFGVGRYVILLIGLSMIFEVLTNTASRIVAYSKYYKAQALMLAVFIVLIVITNMIFIPLYGIVGAAISSLLSRILFSAIRYVYVLYKFGMQPLNYKYLIILIVSLGSYFITLLLPYLNLLVIDVLLRSTLVVIVYVPLLYYLKVSEDLNRQLEELFAKIGISFKD